MIWFVQVNLESNFTPSYQWLNTAESGWPKSEYFCELDLIVFVIGRWTHLQPVDKLNSISHLTDHVWRWLRPVCRIFWSVLEDMFTTYDNVYAKRHREDFISRLYHLCRA